MFYNVGIQVKTVLNYEIKKNRINFIKKEKYTIPIANEF